MKKLILVAITMISMNAFAEDGIGYACLANGPVAIAKLAKLAPKLGVDYLPSIGVLIVGSETCADMHAMMYKDVCKAGPFIVNIGWEGEAELIVKGNNRISLTCEEQTIVEPYSSLGGSN